MTTLSPEQAPETGLSSEVLWYLESRGFEIPDTPPQFLTPEPSYVPGAVFDPEKVDRVLKVFGLLRHTQGKWAGRPLTPDAWQVAYILAPVFGWVRKNSEGKLVRIIRKLYVEVPRKNGKTTLAGGLATYLTCADGEAGAQVYAVASGRDQARFCFDPVRDLAEKSPALNPYTKRTRSRVVHTPTSSYFAVASKVADLLHGANIHGAVIDELHVHQDSSLVETVETGTGSREQPLIVIITTADDGRRTTIYHRRRSYIENLSRGALRDHTMYGVIWAADETDDPHSPETWRKANPGYGVSPSQEFLEAASNEARNSPADLAKFLRLHLGVRTRQATKYIELTAWDRSAGMVDEQALKGRTAWGGLDLSSVEDITALAWVLPREGGEVEMVFRFWLPENRLSQMDKRTGGSAELWVRQGWLRLTEGDTIDNDEILAQIGRDAEFFDVQSIGYDRWGASDVQRRLEDGGLTIALKNQGFAGMTGPLKKLLELSLQGKAVHGGNPVMRWMVDNLAVRMDPAGNVKPDKEKAGDKIDGVSAVCNALSEWMEQTEAERSMYEDEDVEFG